MIINKQDSLPMERGSSLIEVVIALSLFLIITAGVGGLLMRAKEMRRLAEDKEEKAFEITEKMEKEAHCARGRNDDLEKLI